MSTSEFIQGVQVQFYELNGSACLGIAPGHYYNIPLEGVEEDEVHLKGPFETFADARASAEEFIEDAIAEDEGLDISDEEVDFEGDLPIDPNLEPAPLMVEDEEIEIDTIFPVDAAEAA